MEKPLKCVLLLSLKELALRRVAVLLWSDSDILASIAKFDFDSFSFDENETEWLEITEVVIKDKVLKHELPKSLTKPMIDILKPMSLDVRRWIQSHQDYFLDSWDQNYSPDVTKLCWTVVGTIDNRKTAEELVCCDVLYVVQSYLLACFYCLEDYIPLLWKELPEERKEVYYNYKVTEPLLQSCWPHMLKGELSKLDYLLNTSDRNPITFYQYVFEYSAEKGHRTATEYFFRKLTFEEREDSLMRSTHAVLTKIQNTDAFEYLRNFPKEDISSVLCFLLSVMSRAQQIEILESRPLDVLFGFLVWPWQDLFLENASLVWTFLKPSSYGDMLLKMYDRYTDSDFFLPKSYRELIIQSPLDFKKCFVDEEHENYMSAVNFMEVLFDCGDLELLGVIFRNLNAAGRVKLIFHREILKLFYHYGCLEYEWPVVEVCLREVTLSHEDKERLKKAFMEYLKTVGEIDWENHNLKRFFEFLDYPYGNADEQRKAQKRKLENCCAE